MSNDKITIIPPEGYEAVQHEDGTVTFRQKAVEPGYEAMVIHRAFGPMRLAYEQYAVAQAEWTDSGERNYPAPDALLTNPSVRNFRHRRRIEVTITHPSKKWVDQAVGLLEDYLDNHLVYVTQDNMPCAPS